MTLNEWRASERLPLYGAEGDVPMIFGSDGTLRRLVDAVVEPVKAEVPPAEGSGEAGGGDEAIFILADKVVGKVE